MWDYMNYIDKSDMNNPTDKKRIKRFNKITYFPIRYVILTSMEVL